LPFGVTLMGPAFVDEALLHLGAAFCKHPMPAVPTPPGCIAVAVVGAHLFGQPLNSQLLERGARLIKSTKTAPGYRLFELPGQKPMKPGLLREPGFAGPGIEVEVWAVPEQYFGSFVGLVPPPLGIGTAELESGELVKSFVCEPFALSGAKEITHFGGWRNYLLSR
jgi:allophanate hydrolase